MLAGCSTTVVLVEEGEDFAILEGKNVKRSACDWAEVSIYRVDGKRIARMNGTPVKYSDFTAHVAPGPHTVELMALYNDCSWPKTTIGEVQLNTTANKSYRAEMKIDKDIVSMWLVDVETGQIVSDQTVPAEAKDQVIIVPL